MHITHEMRIIRTAESGLEEWSCPTCGRRILLRWPPHYVKHVMDTGDERACHIACTADNAPGDAGGGTAGSTAGSAAAADPGYDRSPRRWLRETGAASALHPT